MKRFSLLTFLLFGFVLMGFALKKMKIQNKETQANTAGFVVMELFTSQGCSSCPPADALLGKYALKNNPNIIPLAFHVAYWNYIGWKDPFGQHRFAERQQQYAAALNAAVYTPELVINGKYQLVGSNSAAVEEIAAKELGEVSITKIKIASIELFYNTIKIRYEIKNKRSNLHLHFALVKKKEITIIKRGENHGLALSNYNVVVDFKTIHLDKNDTNKLSLAFPKNWNPNEYLLISYLQEGEVGKIIAASKNEIKI